mmetsp:Transcript_7890/g.22391  ORF Transcript_7890/g.22391 Transcript_7890/m.22391 type:complete len:405 (+) Transcript_7890:249-1463(+)|eukprot:CAMPEP_0119119042 /NCGR_PEP_ID=MMETSP1310-20130426/710_1 /TAXON_ID=464262 /ORGANISM="Genus nov. species nov., Strain RCC2339" /LENGTH=404 /DNA_ID=CAMNT_0007108453 /DNA_START=216 /DNA_END=1430 /DNA_ORIENTATION=+
MRTWRLLTLLFVGGLAVAWLWGRVTLVSDMFDMGVDKSVGAFQDGDCDLLLEEGVGPYGGEDVVYIGSGVYLVGGGDLQYGMKKPLSDGHPGTLYAVVDKGDRFHMRRLTVQVPEGFYFKPHGLHYSNSSGRLYVVNHADEGVLVLQAHWRDGHPCADAATCVEVPGGDGRRADVTALMFETQRFVQDDIFPYGTLNDVVEGASEREFYVTQWLAVPVPEPGTLWSKILQPIAPFLSILGEFTHVYRCELGKEEETCEIAASGFNMANGITMDHATGRVFVVDGKRLHVLRRLPGGALQRVSIISTPDILDNVEWNGDVLQAATIPSLVEATDKMSKGLDVSVHGGLIEFREEESGVWSHRNLLVHSGDKLSMISAAVRVGESAVLGSPFSPGVLVCHHVKNMW